MRAFISGASGGYHRRDVFQVGVFVVSQEQHPGLLSAFGLAHFEDLCRYQ